MCLDMHSPHAPISYIICKYLLVEPFRLEHTLLLLLLELVVVVVVLVVAEPVALVPQRTELISCIFWSA